MADQQQQAQAQAQAPSGKLEDVLKKVDNVASFGKGCLTRILTVPLAVIGANMVSPYWGQATLTGLALGAGYHLLPEKNRAYTIAGAYAGLGLAGGVVGAILMGTVGRYAPEIYQSAKTAYENRKSKKASVSGPSGPSGPSSSSGPSGSNPQSPPPVAPVQQTPQQAPVQQAPVQQAPVQQTQQQAQQQAEVLNSSKRSKVDLYDSMNFKDSLQFRGGYRLPPKGVFTPEGEMFLSQQYDSFLLNGRNNLDYSLPLPSYRPFHTGQRIESFRKIASNSGSDRKDIHATKPLPTPIIVSGPSPQSLVQPGQSIPPPPGQEPSHSSAEYDTATNYRTGKQEIRKPGRVSASPPSTDMTPTDELTRTQVGLKPATRPSESGS